MTENIDQILNYYKIDELNSLESVTIKHFHDLAKHNIKRLSSTVDSKDLVKIIKGELSFEDSHRISAVVENKIFSTIKLDEHKLVDHFNSPNSIHLSKLGIQNIEKQIEGKQTAIEKLLSQRDLGLFLVRPEAYHLIERIRIILESNGLSIILSKKTEVNSEQYWALCNERLVDSRTNVHVRSRAFGYVNKPLYLFVFERGDNCLIESNQPLSDSLKVLKGIAGYYQKGTIRGDVLYESLHSYFYGDNARLSRLAELALDPIKIYETLSQDTNVFYQKNVLYKRLASLPGVHSPESHELVKDISCLMSKSDIELLLHPMP